MRKRQQLVRLYADSIYQRGLIPMSLLRTPVPEQIPFLDKLLHVSDPDPEDFANHFYIELGVEDPCII